MGEAGAAVNEATAQLEWYLAEERLARQFRGAVHGAGGVFHGWELAHCEAVA